MDNSEEETYSPAEREGIGEFIGNDHNLWKKLSDHDFFNTCTSNPVTSWTVPEERETYPDQKEEHNDLSGHCESEVDLGDGACFNTISARSVQFKCDECMSTKALHAIASLSITQTQTEPSPTQMEQSTDNNEIKNIPTINKKDSFINHNYSSEPTTFQCSYSLQKSTENTMVLKIRLLDAIDQHDIASVRHLLYVDNLNPDFAVDLKNPICQATSLGNIKIMEMLIDSGARPGTPNLSDLLWKRHPIHIAAFKGHLRAMKLLVEHGANINQPDSDQRSPLHWAAMYGQTYMVSWMLAAGSIVNITQSDGFTPLHTATCLGHREVCRLLIDGGADMFQKDCDGWTPLHTAVCYGYIDIVTLLLDKGACPLVTTGLNNDSTLHLACTKGRMDIAELMLHKGVPIESRNSYGFTPLLTAVFYNRVDVAFHLVKRGANVNAVNLAGTSPIYLSAVRCELELIKLLLLAGCKVPMHLSLPVSQHSQTLAAEIDYQSSHPLTLKIQCQVVIRQILAPKLQIKAYLLPLPSAVKRELAMENLSTAVISQLPALEFT